MTLDMAMILDGLFAMMMDLNVLNLRWMALSPQFTSSMWLMMPLYMIYVPLVIFEIYLLLSNKENWAKKWHFRYVSLVLFTSGKFFYQSQH